jgi:hypothetical protein
LSSRHSPLQLHAYLLFPMQTRAIEDFDGSNMVAITMVGATMAIGITVTTITVTTMGTGMADIMAATTVAVIGALDGASGAARQSSSAAPPIMTIAM